MAGISYPGKGCKSEDVWRDDPAFDDFSIADDDSWSLLSLESSVLIEPSTRLSSCRVNVVAEPFTERPIQPSQLWPNDMMHPPEDMLFGFSNFIESMSVCKWSENSEM